MEIYLGTKTIHHGEAVPVPFRWCCYYDVDVDVFKSGGRRRKGADGSRNLARDFWFLALQTIADPQPTIVLHRRPHVTLGYEFDCHVCSGAWESMHGVEGCFSEWLSYEWVRCPRPDLTKNLLRWCRECEPIEDAVRSCFPYNSAIPRLPVARLQALRSWGGFRLVNPGESVSDNAVFSGDVTNVSGKLAYEIQILELSRWALLVLLLEGIGDGVVVRVDCEWTTTIWLPGISRVVRGRTLHT